MKSVRLITISVLVFMIIGCAGKQVLTEGQISERFPKVNELQSELAHGKIKQWHILSPNQFRQAEEAYKEAVILAKNDNDKASSRATLGLSHLITAKNNAKLSADVLEEVLHARTKAINASAQQTNSEDFDAIDSKLLAVAALIEKQKINQAKSKRAELMRAYAALELTSLKSKVIDSVGKMISQANLKKVDNLAPKTFKLGVEEYNLALNTLDADRRDTDKSNHHAQRATKHIKRATEIADIIVHFSDSNFEEEDKVLWFQKQLTQAVSPVIPVVDFAKPNKSVVKDIELKLVALVKSNSVLATSMKQLRDDESRKIREKDLALEAAKVDALNEKRRREALSAKFSLTQSLFKLNEAEVFRQSDNVLIRAHGFSFKSGNSEIDAENFTLLNKIIKAINQFPMSDVVVSGHTDNRGNDESNLSLSTQRAANVAQFLTQVGRIDKDRIRTVGYGKEKPVASNSSVQGRAANRRVEILIVNKKGT